MTITQILIVLRARWKLALLVLLVVSVSVAVANMLRTKQYTATASVVLDVKSPDAISGTVLPGMTALSYMSTQLSVITSERVALRALEFLPMKNEPQLRAMWEEDSGGKGDFRTWIAGGLLIKLDAQPVRDSNVIVVNYTSPDPEYSAAVANAFVKAYIDTTVSLRSEPAKQYNSFFDERAAQLRAQLEKMQARLSAYQQKNGIVATDERLDVENQRLAELTTQLTILQGQATESNTRLTAGTNVGQMQEVLTNPLLLGLTSDLSRLESRLGELTATLGENNPQVAQVRSSIREVRGRIASETARIKGGLSVSDKINQSRLAELRASVADQRNKLLKLKGQRDEASVMIRDVENAQRSYDTIVSRATQSSVESQATQTNVSVLREAQPPSRPTSPKVLLNSMVGVFIGALLALSIVLIRETFDRRLRTNIEVAQLLKVPLLGVLPVGARAASKGRSRLRLTTARAAPALTNSRG